MKQVFINVIGHNGAGKTTLSTKLCQEFTLNHVSGDDFRSFLYEHINYFHGLDASYPDPSYADLGDFVAIYGLALMRLLLKNEQSVLLDGSGSTKAIRNKYLPVLHHEFPDTTQIIIVVNIDEPVLIERLKTRGKNWLKQYQEIKKDSFELPEEQEADTILTYNQINYDEIIKQIRKLTK